MYNLEKQDNLHQLDKKLSPLHVWSLALGCIIGGSAFIMPGETFLPKAGPMGTAIAMILAAGVMIIIAFNYSYMIKKYPAAGGEFIYTNESFGKGHAFVCGWFISLSYLSLVPLNATALALAERSLLNNLFQVGFHYTVAGYDIYFGEILLAFGVLALLTFMSIRGIKISALFQVLLIVFIIGGIFCFTIAAIFSPKATMDNLIPLYSTERDEISCIAIIFAIAPWAYVGFDTVPQAAEEITFSAAKTKLIMAFSILFGCLMYILINTVTAAYIPEGYESWEVYIAATKYMNGLQAVPTFYAAKQLMGDVGLLIIGLAVAAACLSGITGFCMATSRLLYSMAKQQVIPQWFGKLNPKYKTPVNAILFVFTISLLGLIFGKTALGWIVDMSSIGAAIGYGYTSSATLKDAIKYHNSAGFVTGSIGICFAIIFAILLLIPVPGLDCSFGKEAYVCLGIWSALGIIFYLRTKNKRFTNKSKDL